MSWTRRFALSSGLSILFFGVLSNWLGLLPNAGANLVVEAALMALVGLYAVRVSAIGIGLGLFLALFALNADQATLALGLPQLRAGTPDDYWFTTTLPAAAVWFAFPPLARLFARVPKLPGGIAIGTALLLLPALRYVLRPDGLSEIYLHPRPGNFAILPVPWLELVALTTVLATIALVLIERSQTRTLRHIAVPLLVAMTLLVPTADALRREALLLSSLEVDPPRGGPLTPVTVRARVATEMPRTLMWDGQPVTTSSFLRPLQLFALGGVTRGDFLPALEDHQAGSHRLLLRASDGQRQGSFEVSAPAGLRIAIADGHIVVSGGAPDADLDLLTIGPEGPELLHRRFDASGTWRSPLAVSPAAALVIIAQSGDAWVSLGSN